MTRFACFALALGLAFPAFAAEVPAMPVTTATVPVAALAGASPAAVAVELGQPASCESSKQGRKCLYKAGAVEVVFIGGMADWFTVYPAAAFLTPTSLKQLGLPTDQTPAADTGDVIRWDGLQGLREVAAYAGEGGKVSYFYVKAMTP